MRKFVAPDLKEEAASQSSHQNAVQNNGRYNIVRSSTSGEGSYIGSDLHRVIWLYGLLSEETPMLNPGSTKRISELTWREVRTWNEERVLVHVRRRNRKKQVSTRGKITVHPFTDLNPFVRRPHNGTEAPHRN